MTIEKANSLVKRINKAYTISHEFTGNTKKKYVLRFFGEFIGSYPTPSEAALNCVFHDDSRTFRILNP
jgi:hypothetical protein